MYEDHQYVFCKEIDHKADSARTNLYSNISYDKRL